MSGRWFWMGIVSLTMILSVPLGAQPYGQPDRGRPGDAMIQDYLRREAQALAVRFADDLRSLADWEKRRQQYKEEYLYMLGLSPLPPRTPLCATVTGTVAGEGFVVENLHYQSRPGLYVTCNLYRPALAKAGERWPAIVYVCGHSGRGRNGNKTAFQSHGLWFARHGYVCMVIDTLQLGEIAGIHHGTYQYERWWWHSRGYTPAGVECWNGVRGIDYLVGRPDVDPERIAVTGISGGGAATFWIAAADERVRAAVPVSGMADLLAYVPNRVINGHCDCMFLYNAFQWPWTRIAALIAPRPLLFTNSDQDAIFPMDGNERIINRLERLYSLYGAGDRVDAFVSIGGHAYRRDIRQAAFRFMNLHLKYDPRWVTDSEVDAVPDSGGDIHYPIPLERLRVFPKDSDIPADQTNTTIDQVFVPLANRPPPAAGQFEPWKASLRAALRRVTFGYFPSRVPAARPIIGQAAMMESEPGIRFRLRPVPPIAGAPRRIVLVVVPNADDPQAAAWLQGLLRAGDGVYLCEPRGRGATAWTRKNPPNYVERSHVLLGRTVDIGRIWDVAAAARYLHGASSPPTPVCVAGLGGDGILAAYAALWEPEIASVVAVQLPASHQDAAAPQLLNILRVADVPAVLGALAPAELSIKQADRRLTETVKTIYAAAGASERLHLE